MYRPNYAPLTFRIAPHFTLLTYHITPHSDHTIYWPHHLCAPPHLASHHMLHNIASHFTCSTSCIIPLHLIVITPNSTLPHYHVSHNIHITHQYTTTFYIPPLISHNATATTTYRAVSQPTLYLIPHRTTFHIPCHSPHSTWFHIAQRSTFHATSHNVPHSMPQPTLCLIPHHTTFHVTCHSPHSTLFHIAQRSTLHATEH